MTRPAADLSRESVAYRLERLEAGAPPARPVSEAPAAPSAAEPKPAPAPQPESTAPVELGQVQEAWRRSILPAVEERSIPIGKTLAEAHPAGLAGDTLTVEFPRTAAFHLRLAEDPKNAAMLREALYEVTGRKLAVAFALGRARGDRGRGFAGSRRGHSRADEEHLRRKGAGGMRRRLDGVSHRRSLDGAGKELRHRLCRYLSGTAEAPASPALERE